MTCMGHGRGPQMIIGSMPFRTSLMETNAPIDQVMSKTDINHLCVLFIHLCLFIY